jgi:hypothetical protein
MPSGNDTSEIRAVYLQQPGAKVTVEVTQRELILQDFEAMRECKLEHPLMAEIEVDLNRASPPRR